MVLLVVLLYIRISVQSRYLGPQDQQNKWKYSSRVSCYDSCVIHEFSTKFTYVIRLECKEKISESKKSLINK